MNREEAIRLTRAYLSEENEHHFLTLDYHWTLNSLTEYATCWYVDFRYKYPNGERQQLNSGAPGFTIDKREQQIRVISWQELYELNAVPFPF